MALSHAILATLLDRPCSGYDLRKHFEGSVGFFWQASFQQIYRELTKLEEQGWLNAETVAQSKRPDKKIYRVTPLGVEALKTWLATPCDMAALRDDLLVKLFAGHLLPPAAILAELAQHRALHESRLAAYQHIEQLAFAEPRSLPMADKFRYLTLRQGIRLEREWLAWCEEAIALLPLQ